MAGHHSLIDNYRSREVRAVGVTDNNKVRSSSPNRTYFLETPLLEAWTCPGIPIWKVSVALDIINYSYDTL